MARCAFWAYPYFQTPVPEEGYISLYNGSAALLYRCVYNEYFGIETDSEIEESVSNLSSGCLCEICNVVHGSINCVNGDTIYSPDIFGSMDSFVSSNADTVEHTDEGQYQELESNTFESYFLRSDSETDSLNQSSSVDIEYTDDEDIRQNLIDTGHIQIVDIMESDSSSHSASLINPQRRGPYYPPDDTDSYHGGERFITYSLRQFKLPKLVLSKLPNTCITGDIKHNSQERIILNLERQIQNWRNKWRNLNLSKINQKIKRQSCTISRLQQQVKKLKFERNIGKIEHAVESVEKGVQCNTLKGLISDLHSEIDNLHSELNSDENQNIGIETITDKQLSVRLSEKGKPYDENIRKVYYEFLSRNIGLQHIQPIIRTVLSLVNYEINELPSVSTASKMMHELGSVSRHHIEDEFKNDKNLTMHRDATTKKGRHIYGVGYSTESGKILTAGVREVSDGKAETYVKNTKEILNDISESTNFLEKTSNFMTDRSATEIKTNRLLNAENNATGTCMDNNINEFRCAVHPVLQFADICQKEIMKFESNIGFCAASDSKSSSDSKTLTLLRFVSKLFIKMAGTFYLASHLVQYFENSKSTLNFTHRYILKALKDDRILAICRALGIISKIITEPYLNRASDESSTALSMGNVYNRLIDVLKCCEENPYLMLKNDISLFFGPSTQLSDVSTSLFEESLLDSQTEAILAKLVVVLRCKCELLFKDFLKDGKYHEPSNNIIKKSASCPPNNICLERLMAKVDSKFKSAPNCNINSIENTIMYSGNKTGAWLEKKSADDKKNIISEARKSNRSNIKIMKERKSNLFKSHVAIIRQREEQQKKKLEKRSKHKQDVLEQMRDIGIWEDRNKINTELEKCRTKTKKLKL
ncbi:unnamed protein product [Mytilus edulis]|uniref:Uncharacterized protein n=1 Tax=Mytilus edulis TaxID=6550 RepID=A0A8S3SV68_MYTED|nr:unnamed protein product [Mytilus edulis]